MQSKIPEEINEFEQSLKRENMLIGQRYYENEGDIKEKVRYYIAGDTDCTKEASKVECDVAFLPVRGTYTMDYIEAASLATKINPKYVIPTHYGSIVGNKEDGELFKNSLSKKIKCELLLKN